jgi:deoxycytidylate deaminase
MATEQSHAAASELVLAFAGAVGVELDDAEDIVEQKLKVMGYDVTRIRITTQVIPIIIKSRHSSKIRDAERVHRLMDAGNQARQETGNNGVLAFGVAKMIEKARAQKATSPKRAYLVHSLKHPDEVAELRRIYPRGFYLIAVHADLARKWTYLTERKGMTKDEAKALMRRDMNEELPHGQRIVHTFHLADFFVRLEQNKVRLENSISRIIDILFGDMHRTPTFGEYAMFLAFSSSLRSGDLSRQVGAVIANKREVLAKGANDCPRTGGGLYWPEYNRDLQAIEDAENGRDAMRGSDSNMAQQRKMIDEIVLRCESERIPNTSKIRAVLEASSIKDLTEFGRVVHAEMEAILSCARKGISTVDTTLYCTTFPCHNCAKHIIAAGVTRVVFIEPYLKSRAISLHDDSLRITYEEASIDVEGRPQFVLLEPFVGVGPRRFFDLFSTRLGTGIPVERKDKNGQVVKWKAEGATLRIPMLPLSYLDEEHLAANASIPLPRREGPSNRGGGRATTQSGQVFTSVAVVSTAEREAVLTQSAVEGHLEATVPRVALDAGAVPIRSLAPVPEY